MAKCSRCGKSGLFFKVNNSGMCSDCELIQLRCDLQKEKENSKSLQQKYELLDKSVTPEMRDAITLNQFVDSLHNTANALHYEIDSSEQRLKALQEQILVAEETIEMESFSLYKPTYAYAASEEYKEKLDAVRQEQKKMLKSGDAAKCSTIWTINGSKVDGKKQTNDSIKLFLRAFNVECDSAIRDVKFSNFDRCAQRIEKSYEQINNLGRVSTVAINYGYLQLKMKELRLAFEYAQKKQQEKDDQAEIRRQQREQAKLNKEIAEARKAAEKERLHFEQALSAIDAQLNACTDTQRKAELESRRAEIRDGLDGISAKLEDIDYRQSNQRAGYVYIISNIGAFGENVYKIGMTRRLNPMERVDELGDASVPFYFDVHAMIFSEDAPALEAALHHAFEDKRLNKVNTRREYFRVTLDEIKEVVRANHDKSVEFIDVPAAEQYRESLRM